MEGLKTQLELWFGTSWPGGRVEIDDHRVVQISPRKVRTP